LRYIRPAEKSKCIKFQRGQGLGRGLQPRHGSFHLWMHVSVVGNCDPSHAISECFRDEYGIQYKALCRCPASLKIILWVTDRYKQVHGIGRC